MSTTPADGTDTLFLSFQQALVGRYSIDRELGRGGMGIVYLAREVHLDRWVAIKLLPPVRARDQNFRERFLREARLAAKLSHPNIIPIHSVEDANEFVFYVMAFVDGETLADRVRERGPLNGAEGTRVLREVAWALSHAHSQGVVHRDVKPDNILLEGTTGRVLVADFGIAAALADTSGSGAISGTPEFMSPEQVLGMPLDPRSDLYSLGATAFFAMSGKLPFEGSEATQVMARQVTEPAPPIASMGIAVPRKVGALIDRCLAKEPGHRPESAQALAEHLALAMEQRREAPPALRAFVKRNGRLDGGGTLVVGFLLVPIAAAVAAVVGTTAGYLALAVGAIIGPIGYLVAAARRLALMGFTHDDLIPAFRADIETAQEELFFGHRGEPTVVERLLGVTAAASGAVFGVAALYGMVTSLETLANATIQALLTTLFFSFSTAIFATIGWLALVQRHRAVDSEVWAKLWLSRFGSGIFALGRKLLGKRVRATAMTHRATELSLGMAAEELYESLPKRTREELTKLPPMLRRLQADAQSLRARYEKIQEALADLGDAATSAEFSDLRAARDTVQGKLAETVGALETIRLDLLRLHAGNTTIAGVTTHLDLAADISAEVGRLIAAQGEVDRLLLSTPSR